MMKNKSRHVNVWRTALSEVLGIEAFPHSSSKDILQILQNMYNVSVESHHSIHFGRQKSIIIGNYINYTFLIVKVNKRKMKIPETTFCLEFSPIFIEQEVTRWRQQSKSMVGLISFFFIDSL